MSIFFLILCLFDLIFVYRIQYTRHLHERVHNLENRTAPPKEDPHIDNSAALGLGLGGPGLLSDTLMITNGPAYGGKYNFCRLL